jgi:hypothetical protein
MFATPPQLFEIKKFGYHDPEEWPWLGRRFVHSRYARLDVGKVGIRSGLPDGH